MIFFLGSNSRKPVLLLIFLASFCKRGWCHAVGCSVQSPPVFWTLSCTGACIQRHWRRNHSPSFRPSGEDYHRDCLLQTTGQGWFERERAPLRLPWRDITVLLAGTIKTKDSTQWSFANCNGKCLTLLVTRCSRQCFICWQCSRWPANFTKSETRKGEQKCHDITNCNLQIACGMTKLQNNFMCCFYYTSLE